MRLEIVTPDTKVYSEEVEHVSLPAVEGEMDVYPNHVPLVTQIVAGEVLARKDGKDYFLAVGEGFVEITAERVAILTDMAIQAENIDEAKAEEARRRAEARLREKLGDEESAMVNAALAHSLAQLKVKRRK
jgi:F-type H+-transporting ATPase subunit epsilon